LGISRSTYFRRRKQARKQAALAQREDARAAVFERTELQWHLDLAATFHEAMAAELDRPVPFVW
jgi:hypothetical protein